VYDGVRKTVGDMRDEAQYAAWYWVVESGPECTGYTESGGGCEERESIGWHPCFTLPANRYVDVFLVLLLPSSFSFSFS
jgi:hypothetical protein